MLYLGTMFAPIQDRDIARRRLYPQARDDIVAISSPTLGTLVNTGTSVDRMSALDLMAAAI